MPDQPPWAMRAADRVFTKLIPGAAPSPTARSMLVGLVAEIIQAEHKKGEKGEIILHCPHCEHCQQAVIAASEYHFRESDEKHQHCAVCVHWNSRQCPVSPRDFAPNHGLCDHFMWPPKDWYQKEKDNGHG